MSEKNWTVLKLLSWTTEYFQKAELESPRLLAEMLLSHVLECERIELYTRFEHLPTDAQRATFREFVRRAGQHEPVAYLTGTKEFYSLPMKVTPVVLIPRPETEMLVDLAVTHLRSLGRPGWVWDICTGSGCVALATAQQVPTTTVLATDISTDAVAVAHDNATSLGLADRVTCLQADLLTRPASFDGPEQFDVITANPPYVATGDWVAPSVTREPDLALYAGETGFDIITPLVRSAGDQGYRFSERL